MALTNDEILNQARLQKYGNSDIDMAVFCGYRDGAKWANEQNAARIKELESGLQEFKEFVANLSEAHGILKGENAGLKSQLAFAMAENVDMRGLLNDLAFPQRGHNSESWTIYNAAFEAGELLKKYAQK